MKEVSHSNLDQTKSLEDFEYLYLKSIRYRNHNNLFRNLARWVPLFKAGKSNFMDETHNGRPITEINIASIDLL